MEQTVQKALRLLEALVRSGKPRRLTELARELELTKPNVYRLLSTLTILGYVRKDPANSHYSATLRMWEMGSLLVREVDLATVAAPRLRRLGEQTRESVQLAVFDAGFAVCMDKVDGASTPAVGVGERVPAVLSSAGKALLAWLPAEAFEQAMRNLESLAVLAAPSRAQVEQDLAQARLRGYAVQRGELRAGLCGLAAPVRDRKGDVVAAVGILGAEKAILGARREAAARNAIAAACDISRDLGWLDPVRVPAKGARAALEETA